MTIFKSISSKFSFPIATLTIIFIVAIVAYNSYLLTNLNNKSIDKQLKMVVADIESSLSSIENKALWISSSYANLDFVKQAYKQYYETNDLVESSIIIENQMLKVNQSIEANTNKKAFIHFHLPPAKSFIRCWSSVRGDDISDFRNTVLDVSKNHKPVAGIEVGRGGFVIRGICPIFDNNEYIGSVETLFPISTIFTGTKYPKNVEFAVFMDTTLLKTATKFLEKQSSNITSDKKQIGKLIHVQKTSEKFLLSNISANDLNNALQDTISFTKGNLNYIMLPLNNFAGKPEGVYVVQIDNSEQLSLLNAAETQNLFIGIFFIIILVILVVIVVKLIVSKPIRSIKSYMERIANKDINFDAPANKNDEIGMLFISINKINENFREIISKIELAAQQLNLIGEQNSNISTQIALRAEKTSSKMGYLAKSIDNITTKLHDNTDNAELTAQLSGNAVKETQNSNSVIISLIQEVDKINNKIEIISQIADQIDILSINAGIEAARAGENGKGFGVVAQEVRKLSDITKNASDEISKISGEGHKISQIASEKLTKLIPEIIKSSEQINMIAKHSREQSNNSQAINKEFQNLAQIADNNLVATQNLSESAEELTVQAKELLSLVSVFNTHKG